MALTKVLITVKTYPTLSEKYDELVCTAGFREDGTWVRIYPIPFRKKDYEEKYKKYDWIEIDLVKNESDFRPESYRPKSVDTEIKILSNISTENNWVERKRICLQKVYDDMTKLIEEAKDENTHTSLAVFKPTKIIDFYAEPTDREWDKDKLNKIIAGRLQYNLFQEELSKDFQVVKKLPYQFKFNFLDINGRESHMMIEDWETGQLYWNCLKKHSGNEEKAIEDVRKKYFDDFAKTKDLYFFMGTTLAYHKIGKNPFIIIGTFHPKITPSVTQNTLF
jgi:hypothetical protein